MAMVSLGYVIRAETNEKLIQTIILLGASCVYAQTTNLTFQWHGQTMEVEFEVTNQYVRQIAAFSNFFHHVKTGFDVTGLTLAEKMGARA